MSDQKKREYDAETIWKMVSEVSPEAKDESVLERLKLYNATTGGFESATNPEEVLTHLRHVIPNLDQSSGTLVGSVWVSDLSQRTREDFGHTLGNSDSISFSLVDLRASSLGKSGWVNTRFREVQNVSPIEQKLQRIQINSRKSQIEQVIKERAERDEARALEIALQSERVDVTLPLTPDNDGRVHPVSQALDEIIAIFCDMGFSVADGPDIETDDHNFTKLNIPADHPARQMHDTFYMARQADGSQPVLRTHTSPVQVRTMLSQQPPIRIIVPGRVYRCDSDQTHTPMFHQVEGLVIDETTHMGHLKWVLEEFCRAFFEVDSVRMRFRPSYFPFTEPSAEVDIQCDRRGDEIRFGEGRDWLEILGCGMVHPNVLTMCGIDPTRYQGFAFGMGIDRVAMLKYGIPDLRAFFQSDLRWLKHYGFAALDVPTLAGGLSK